MIVEYENGKKTVQREDRNFDGTDNVITRFDANEQPVEIREDSSLDGNFDTFTYFEAGQKSRTERDRNQDGKPDVFAYYEGGQVVRQEEDSDFDGTIDKKSAAGAGGTQIQEADTNGDGAIDTWITTNAAGEVIKKDEDRNGNGKADLVAWFEGGKISRLEQDTGRGCVDLKQWFDGNGKVRAEYKDANGDCKIDAWSYFKNEVLVRQGVDNSGNGRPDVLNHLNGSGQLTIQEVASGDNGRNPDKKLFLDAAGQVTAQCLLDANKKKLNTRALVSGGVVGEVLIDTNGNGYADTRQVLSGRSAGAPRRRHERRPQAGRDSDLPGRRSRIPGRRHRLRRHGRPALPGAESGGRTSGHPGGGQQLQQARLRQLQPLLVEALGEPESPHRP